MGSFLLLTPWRAGGSPPPGISQPGGSRLVLAPCAEALLAYGWALKPATRIALPFGNERPRGSEIPYSSCYMGSGRPPRPEWHLAHATVAPEWDIPTLGLASVRVRRGVRPPARACSIASSLGGSSGGWPTRTLLHRRPAVGSGPHGAAQKQMDTKNFLGDLAARSSTVELLTATSFGKREPTAGSCVRHLRVFRLSRVGPLQGAGVHRAVRGHPARRIRGVGPRVRPTPSYRQPGVPHERGRVQARRVAPHPP